MDFFTREIKKERNALGLKDTHRALTRKKEQTGTSNIKRDIARKSMPPGKRISNTGRIYYESRKNRSDLFGEKL